MIRIVVVTFLLLIVISGSADAECAWVLWQREIINKRDIGWVPREGFTSAGDCKKRESKADMVYKRDTQKLEPSPGGHTICLPDTVDPRVPKAK